jgi:hypothetical protein
MRYICLIYNDEQGRLALPEDERKRTIAAYGEFTESIRASGNMLGGDALHPATTATTVRVRNGETLVTDGPFAETKEQLAGFYLIEAKDADEAISIAARIPGAQYGSIEVRPLFSDEDYEG